MKGTATAYSAPISRCARVRTRGSRCRARRARGWYRARSIRIDGGYGFAGSDPLAFDDAEARGYRADLSIGFGDFIDKSRGRLALYSQNLDGGYSAPGFSTLTDLKHYGGMIRMPIGENLT
jgi:hypothetical protein